MGLSPELLSGFLGFIFTLLILSYLLGDNPLFRIATYLFVGVSAGYVASVVWYQVLWPDLVQQLQNNPLPGRALLIIPLLLGVLLLMKISPRLSWLGGPAIAVLVGVGAAVAVGGAIMGTLLPQVQASLEAFNPPTAVADSTNSLPRFITGAGLLLGTVSTLAYFHFGAKIMPNGSIRRNFLVEGLAWLGRLFIAITFGMLFAGVYAAALTAWIERLTALWAFVQSL